MIRVNKAFILFFLSALLFFVSISKLGAQQKIDPEKEYLRIRDLAYDGNLQDAENATKDLIELYPSYGDAHVLLARVMAWQGKYEPAIHVLDNLLSKDPGNLDAIEARNDINRWMEQGQKDPDNNKLQGKSRNFNPNATGYDLRANFHFDTFTEPFTRFWKVFGLGAGKSLPGKKFIGGLNAGHIYMDLDSTLVRKTEIQLETEAYMKINSKNYFWLAYAFSPGEYFPAHRAAGEIWHNFSQGWVASAGLNYYYFDRHIFIASGSVEKYLGSYWISGKINIYFKENGMTSSFYLNARKYFTDVNYLQLTFGTGTAPDEPYDIRTDLYRLTANIFRITYFTALTDKISLRAGLGYSYEEYFDASYRNRFDGNIGFVYLLPGKNEN